MRPQATVTATSADLCFGFVGLSHCMHSVTKIVDHVFGDVRTNGAAACGDTSFIESNIRAQLP